MKKYASVAAISAVVSMFIYAHAVPQKTSPGLEPFTSVRIDWLVTSLQANLRESRLDDKRFTLDITASDPETVDIYVRYLPTVDRRTMNLNIETARKLIQIKSKSYGWDGWVKIKEDVEPADPTK